MLNRLDTHFRELMVHASAAFALKVIAAALSFALSVALARTLGADATGTYFLVYTLVTIAAVVSRSGIDRAGLRAVAASAAAGRTADVRQVYKLCVVTVATFSALFVLGLVASSGLLTVHVFAAELDAVHVVIGAFAVIPLALANLHAELLKGLKRISAAIAVQSAWLPALTLAGVLVAVPRFGLSGAITAMLFAATATMILGFLHWRIARPDVVSGSSFSLGELLRESTPLFWVGLFQLVIAQSATIVLGMFQDAAEIGRFAVASRTATLTSFVLFAVNSIAAPKFAELYRQRKLQELQTTAIHAAGIMSAMAAPFLVTFVVVPEAVMNLFGPGFGPGYPALTLLAIGQFVNVVTGSVGYLLAMTGNGPTLRNTLAFSASLHLVLCFPAAYYFGAIGCAAATAFTMATMNLILAWRVWAKLGIITLPFLYGIRGRDRRDSPT